MLLLRRDIYSLLTFFTLSFTVAAKFCARALCIEQTFPFRDMCFVFLGLAVRRDSFDGPQICSTV